MGRKDNSIISPNFHLMWKLMRVDFFFNFQVSIHFELGEQKWERDVIMHKVKERLSTMNINLGELIDEPIAIMCFHKSTL